MHRWLALTFLVACSQGSDAPIQTTHDICAPPSLMAVPSPSAAQADAISAAEAVWRTRGAPALGLRAGVALEIRFQTAAPEFHGFYDDQASVIYINDQLTDPTALSIVIEHELGHAFGLTHVNPDERASVMNPGNLTVLPTAEDQRTLESLWGVCP